jgi:hypothetical protein
MSVVNQLTNVRNMAGIAALEMESQVDQICADQGLEFSGRETLAWVTSPKGVKYRVSILVESCEVAEAYND